MKEFDHMERQLDELKLWRVFRQKCIKNSAEEAIAIVREVGEYSVNKLKTVICHMGEFTLHDEVHVINMLHIADRLIPDDVQEQLSIPDMMLIFLSVFLHDIGMCPEEKYIRAWKALINPDDYENLSKENLKFNSFRNTFPKTVERIEELANEGKYAEADQLEDYLISEYIRKNHAKNVRSIIAKEWSDKIYYNRVDLLPDLIDICYSHNENYTYILQMPIFRTCGEDEIICIRFVAVILRLADIIDFDAKRTPSVLFSHLAVKNPVSIIEWKKHRSISAWTIRSDRLIYSAQCEHPAIEAAVRKFCDLIDNELSDCTLILANLYDNAYEEELKKYRIRIPAKVNRDQIEAKKDALTGEPLYKYHDTIFSLNKKQVIDLLMGTHLYDDPEVALRELIQNSVDACMVRKTMNDSYAEVYTPMISVRLYTIGEEDYLCVDDNGIGMNQHIIDEYYTKIGVSYYKSSEFYELMRSVKGEYKPVSCFGIGILSAFMVCDEMTVETKRMMGRCKYDEPLNITIEGYESLFVIRKGERNEAGTSTYLKLRKDHPWRNTTKENFYASIKKAIPNPPIPIRMIYQNEQEIHDDFEMGTIEWENFVQYNNWIQRGNIKFIDLIIDDAKYSFTGKARVAYIIERGIPCSHLELPAHDIMVGNIGFQLSTKLTYNAVGILKESTSLELTDNNKIKIEQNTSIILSSNSILSIKGIGVPYSIFRNGNNFTQKAILNFPIPILLLLDIGQNTSLELNTARTQIVYNNEWKIFEKRIIEVICKGLKTAVPDDWEILKAVIIKRLVDSQLQEIIEKI